MIVLNNVRLPIDYKKQDLKRLLSAKLKIDYTKIEDYRITKLSVDARKKTDVFFVANFIVSLLIDETKFASLNSFVSLYKKPNEYELLKPKTMPKNPVVVVGSGPSGLFCSLMLAKSGLKPIVIERGECVEDRIKTVEKLWNEGILNEESNIQFGEGGAGTFSDGKLTTGIKDERKNLILENFYKYGADESILYNSKPHIGTDKLTQIVKNIRNEIIALGGQVLFSHKLTDFVIENNAVKGVIVKNLDKEFTIETENVVLAIGHSARDTYELLKDKNFSMNTKPFSIGVRIEQKQADINKSQYGEFANRTELPPAEYKLACHLPNGRGVYTFCMCPGGEVVASQSENGSIVTNGMSSFSRSGENCNSAVLVSVDEKDFDGKDVLSGVRFQKKYEELAYQLTQSSKAPAQRVGDFLNGTSSKNFGKVRPTYKPGVVYSDLSKCLPKFAVESLKQGLKAFERNLRGFSHPENLLIGVETRSSSPLKVERNDDFESSVKGVYPCGEGCGFAGGIMSAAIDGVKCYEAICKKFI